MVTMLEKSFSVKHKFYANQVNKLYANQVNTPADCKNRTAIITGTT